MQIIMHQPKHQLCDFREIFTYLQENLALSDKQESAKSTRLHLFSELFLSGYPLQDLCLDPIFMTNYLAHLKKIDLWAKKQKGDWCALMGGLKYETNPEGLPEKIYNVIFELRPQEGLRSIYSKKLLPNYDIFDELKYFHPGDQTGIYQYHDKTFGVMICEDMWPSIQHRSDPTLELAQKCHQEKIALDAIINLSASPYHYGKQEKRIQRAKEITDLFDCPLIYINRVAAEDEILFDGQSFIIDSDGKIQVLLKKFSDDQGEWVLTGSGTQIDASKATGPQTLKNSWEDFYGPQLVWHKDSLPTVPEMTFEKALELTEAICFGLQEYAKKTHHKKFVVALSGGIDSALVCALTKLSLHKDQELMAIYMPSQFSSSQSWELCEQLCLNLNIPLKSWPIKFFHSSIRNSYLDTFSEQLRGVADENIQSRLRGALIYAYSNQNQAMVINTSNRSEIAVGYSTLYGDSVGAISLIGDLYKTEVFALSRALNAVKSQEIIPEALISRAPTAELREQQKDEDSLPPYQRLDSILELILNSHYSLEKIIDFGFSQEEVMRVYHLYERSEFKRSQFCPIIKIRPKSFGFGHRIPICKKSLNIC